MYNITNATGLDGILVNLASNVPQLFPMILLFEFLVIGLGGSFATSRKTGYTNLLMWFAIAGLVTSTSAFILFLVDGIIPLTILSIVVAISILFAGLFILLGDNQQQ